LKKAAINLYKVLNSIWWLIVIGCYKIRNLVKKDVVFCECFVKIRGFQIKMRKNNWGDDINKYFFEWITGKKFVFIPYERTFIRKKVSRYSMIGSIAGMYGCDNLIIYGSGVIDPRMELWGGKLNQPVISVRGPRTRAWIMEQGYDCPENYGDPALLLSQFYVPKKRESKKICVIPHKATVLDEKIKERLEERDCEILNLENYDKWTDIIDTIAAAECVISESLHGLIVAETYDVPNVWVDFIPHWENWEFKYLIYFESIKKNDEKSLKLYEEFEWEAVDNKVKNWKKGNIDYKNMLDVIPFEYKKGYRV